MIDMFTYLLDRVSGRAPKGAKRSKDWRKVRRDHLKKNPLCVVCHGTKKLQVHHMIPFYIAPQLELEKSNLITLCTSRKPAALNCHLLIGHLGDFQSANPDCSSDAWAWHNKLKRGKVIAARARDMHKMSREENKTN